MPDLAEDPPEKPELRWCARCGFGEDEYMACEEPDCGPLMTSFEFDILRDFEELAGFAVVHG